MNAIAIQDVGVDDDGRLGITAKDEDGGYEIHFDLPERFTPANDLIALATLTLVGTKYGRITYDLPITEATRATIEKVAKAEVFAPELKGAADASRGGNIGLNFSGGFDSLACLDLMPYNTELVSLDFGGAFAREEEFFSRFDTSIIGTNFRALGFARNNWTFMGVGPILLRDYLELGAYSFGTSLQASIWNLKQVSFSNAAQPVFTAAGLKQYNPVLGLTEVGSTILLASNQPHLVEDSLNSLAAPGSEKFSRKALLYNLVLEDLGMRQRFKLPVDPIVPRNEFGSFLPEDLLALYLLKRRGVDHAEQIAKDVPASALEFVKVRSLNFFERLNPIFYTALPRGLKSIVYQQCALAGIEPYGETDWIEYRDSLRYLSEWHSGLVK